MSKTYELSSVFVQYICIIISLVQTHKQTTK